MNNKQLTTSELFKYIKEHGITKVKLTESFYQIPKDTILWFGNDEDDNFISTYDSDTENKNKEFNYDFNYERCKSWCESWCESWYSDYKGKFEIIEKEDKLIEKHNKEVKDLKERQERQFGFSLS